MAGRPTEPSARAAAGVGPLMIEDAHRSVVRVRSGSRDAGAGVIPASGLVLTNDHVLPGRRPGVRVVLRDGRTLDAEVARRSLSLDLALLRLHYVPEDLVAASAGDSATPGAGSAR